MSKKKESEKEETKSCEDKIRVISKRDGDIICPCGAVLKKDQIAWVESSSIELLKACFADFLVIIE